MARDCSNGGGMVEVMEYVITVEDLGIWLGNVLVEIAAVAVPAGLVSPVGSQVTWRGIVCAAEVATAVEAAEEAVSTAVNLDTLEEAIYFASNAKDDLNFTHVNGKPIRIMFSHRDPSLRKSGYANLFIKNLDQAIDTKALFKTFSAFGTVLSCKIAVDHNENSRGYGFVQNPQTEEIKSLIGKPLFLSTNRRIADRPLGSVVGAPLARTLCVMGRPRFAPAGFGGNSPPFVAFPLLQWTPSPLPPSPARVDRGPEIPLSLTYRRCRDTPSPRPLHPTRQVIVAACSWWRRWSRRSSLFLVRSLPLNTIRAGKRNVTVEPGRG
ncbi:hypothetical protein SASPL_102012 [Salvia splendens]|uniref:RRM domain-containing protein n=1 Tax=Salvia splendens TaxID=180675 RepID=A0A8X9ABR2_SALSN|nr:hypothetical protein SASPL_102012 [Salvia splendens]